MNNKLKTLVIAAACAVVNCTTTTQPVHADSGKLSGWKSASIQALGVVAGVVVGVPVSMIRRPFEEEKYGIAQMAGDNGLRAKIPAAIFYFPFAVVSGAFEAPWYAINDSVVNYDKPFSKEQFSLVDPEEDNGK